MLIINGCERFRWKECYWVKDGAGDFKNNKNKSSPGMIFFGNESSNPKVAAIKVVDNAINKLIT